MKTRKLIINIISSLFIIVLYYFTKNTNIFLYTISLYLYLILSSMFSHIDTYPNLKKYYDNNHIYSLNKIYKYTNISIFLLNILISIIIFVFSYLVNKIFNIEGFILVNTIMSLTLFISPVIKNIKNFISVYSFKKLSDNLENIYKVLNLFLLLVVAFFSFKIFKFNSYISIMLLYLTNILSFIIVYLFCYNVVLVNKIRKKQFRKKEERINYKKEIKEILSQNKNNSFIKIVGYSYFYISIIILYFILKNKYGYSYDNVSIIINDCYLYAVTIINIILIFINYFEQDNIDNIKNNIKNKKYEDVKLDYYLIKIFKVFLSIMIIIGIISDSLWTLIFNNDNGFILYMFSALGIFYIMYNILVNISVNNISDKKLYLSLTIGLIIKLIITVPLIDSFYRMGYNLLYGDMLSNFISYFVVSILLIISNSRKCKIDFIKNFDKILNIIYYNIILCVILLLFSLIIPVTVDTRLEGLKVVIIYLFLSLVYIYLRREKDKKNE